MFIIPQISKMKRKEQPMSLSRLIFRKTNKNAAEKEEAKADELIVTVRLPHRNPLILSVPVKCNMKILRSMIQFHLKKTLCLTQYSQIIGFQTEQNNYQLDYLLQNGIGELTNNLSVNCLLKTERKEPRSLLNFKICKLISMGGFSKVYLLRDLQNGQFRAGKFIIKQNANPEMVQNEYNLSSNINHPFILRTYDLIETEHFYIFILDFYPGGELFQLLKKNRHMNEEKARFYIVEVLLALQYLHQQSIAFRDIKPENILLDQYGHIKLVDFGLAKMISRKSFSFCGSLDYMAPEIIKDEGHSFEVDFYAVGNLLFEILVGSPPFYHPKFTTEQTKYHILNTEVRYPDYLNLSNSVIDLMSQLLHKEPMFRLGSMGGINEILSHHWFNSVNTDAFMSKSVTPPITMEISLVGYNEDDIQNKKMWESLLQKDIKQAELRESMRCTKTAKGNRHRSLDSQKSCEDKSTDKVPKGVQIKVNSKMKTNMCLLYVLTHKRVTSECPTSQNNRNRTINQNFKALKSMNISRKSSVLHHSQNKLKTSAESPFIKAQNSQPHLKTNFTLIGGENKEKESINIKKGKKENQPFYKARNKL